MARVQKMCGFETGALLAEDAATVTGSVAIESTIVRSGSYSCKVTPASGAAGNCSLGNFAGLSVPYVRFYIRLTSLPASTRAIFGGGPFTVRVTSSGTVELLKADTTLVGTSTVALTDTTKWYRIEVRNEGGSNTLELRADGRVEVTGTQSGGAGTNLGCNLICGTQDTVAATYTAYYDDLVLDDAAYPGESRVIMLLPTSVNAAGGWVEGDGAGTANMAAAVATRPPPGLASANETNATNIESPTNSASDNCDMNMTTYTAAGIGATDTIHAVHSIVRHGEDIATTTKAGAVHIVSNPTQGSEDAGWNFGLDTGAHGAEVGNWETKGGTLLASPSVTLGTAPVLRVGKRTATTRVVCVDFMGIYVEYTPLGIPGEQPRKSQKALNRRRL